MPEANRLSKGHYTPKKADRKKIRIDQAEQVGGLHNLFDEELYARHVDGCKRSFAILFQRHNERIVRRLMTRFRFTHATAEEVAQDVWCRISYGYELRGEFGGMIWSACRSIACDKLRAAAKRDGLFTRHYGQELTDNASVTYEDCLVKEERSSSVRQAVQGLDPSLRRAIRLVFYRGLSYRQAANRLGIAESTIRYHLELAKGLIFDRLA